MYKLPISRTNLGRLYNLINSEAINEDQSIVPKEVVKRQFKAVNVMNEIVKPPSKIDQKTAFTIDLYINNINDELNTALESTKSFIQEVERTGQTDFDAQAQDIISDWNKLVIYLKSFEKSENITVKEKDYIWERLTTETLPNLAELIQLANKTKDELGKPILTDNETNKLLELEENIYNKQFVLIKGVSPATKAAAEKRESERRREGEKDAKFIQNFIRDVKDDLMPKEELLKRAFSENEIQYIQAKLREIKGLPDKNQRDNLKDELIEQITKRMGSEKGRLFAEDLRKFQNRLAGINEKQLRKTSEYYQDLLNEAEEKGDLDLKNRISEKLRAVADEMLSREGLTREDLDDEDAIDDKPDVFDYDDDDFYIPEEEKTPPVSSRGSTTRSEPFSEIEILPRKKGRKPKAPASAIDIEAEIPRKRGKGRPLLNKVMNPRYNLHLNANEKNRNALPFDDKGDDPYYILRKMNIH
jgi:hypothetical protein